MKKIYIKNNYLIIEFGKIKYQRPASLCLFYRVEDKAGRFNLVCPGTTTPSELVNLLWSDFVDVNNNAFANEQAFNDWLTANTGYINFNWGSISPEQIVLVDNLSKLPSPVSGVISLEDKKTYIIIGDVDLLGNRIVSNGVVVNLFGLSSETSSLTSSGLTNGVSLITSDTTIKLRDITIKDVNTCFSLNKSSAMALDWDAVNIVNIPNVGIIQNCDNFIFNKGTLFNSKNFNFTGTIATIAISDSLLQGDGLSGNIINISSSAVITRRFRIDKSAVVAFGSTIGINFNVAASVPVENYILDTVNFSGGGTYISGVNSEDNKAYFKNNNGIKNSNEIVLFYTNGNALETIITALNTPVKISFSSILSSILNQKFTVFGNRATYNGSIIRVFKVTCTSTLTSGNNNQIGFYIAKNGVVIDNSEMYVTTNGNGRAENISCQTIIELQNGDYLETFIENNTAINNITVTDVNFICM